MKKSSTGALTKEQHEIQDQRYAEGHEYDYVIIGSGHSALVVGSLLAKAGNKICILEAHDVPGGYAHTFKAGDYSFCAQIHYTWSCGPGAKMYQFLEKLGLERKLTWNLYDSDGYDQMVMPDGQRVKIPYGWDRLAENIDAAYPGQKEKVVKFTGIMARLREEMRYFPEKKIHWWELPLKARKLRCLLKYRTRTLQEVFNECGLSPEAQAVLIANSGDLAEPPERLSVFCYAGLFGGYNTGAYYPTKHFQGYIGGLADFIKSQGGQMYFETEVTKVNTEADRVIGVETKNGRTFTAKKGFICNMDPQAAAKRLIGWNKFPPREQKKLDYEYSLTGLMIYLGLDDKIDLRDHGFGNFNIWHLEQWDMNKMWREQKEMNFARPWFFMSTPTLHTEEPGMAPPGCQILEIASFMGYEPFRAVQRKSYGEYMKLKIKLADRLLDLVEERYLPDLRQHIVVKQIGSPTTNEDFCLAPKGNAYGSAMTPAQVGLSRLKARTPWPNFWWCNASSGYAGIAGTLHTGLQLYMDLSGDYFIDSQKLATDDELIAALPKQLEPRARHSGGRPRSRES